MNPSDYSDLVMAVSIISTISISAAFLYGSFRFINTWTWRQKAQVQDQSQAPRYDTDAIARLQASVDAVSIEVERIAEGQRFTTKLMSERMPEAALLPQSRDKISGVSQ
ncbi:MAG: hypothetical protein ABJC63_03205 [Gemmatimonadales bacterium]